MENDNWPVSNDNPKGWPGEGVHELEEAIRLERFPLEGVYIQEESMEEDPDEYALHRQIEAYSRTSSMKPRPYVSFSWRYGVVGVYRARDGQGWLIYPLPFFRIKIWSKTKEQK